MQKPRGENHVTRSRTERWKPVLLRSTAPALATVWRLNTYTSEQAKHTQRRRVSQCACVNKHTHTYTHCIHVNRQHRAVHEALRIAKTNIPLRRVR